MKICIIGDSSSIHVQRMVAHFVQQKDDVLILSSARYKTNIYGCKTIHLLADVKWAFAGNAGKVRKPSIGWVKSFVPRSIKVFVNRTIRDVALFSKRMVCMEEIERFNPEVIFCNRSFPEGMLAVRCHAKPLILRTAGPDISKLTRYPVYRQIVRRAIQSADVVVTESLWEEKLLRDLCGEQISVEICIIGIDCTVFRPLALRDSLRRKYGLPGDAFVIVSNRYLDGHYNGWLVVEAIQRVLEQCPKLVLLYVSPARLGPRAKAKVEAIEASFRRIKFINGPLPHSEVADILRCGDVYMSFSSFDGIPNSVLEAMACGVVPIVAELPQLHEWLEHGVTGYFVKQYDSKGLATMVTHAYRNREVLSDMSVRCVSTIRERGSYEVCMERTRNLMKSLVQAENGGYGYINEQR